MKLGKNIFQGIGIVIFFSVVGLASIHNLLVGDISENSQPEVLKANAEVVSEVVLPATSEDDVNEEEKIENLAEQELAKLRIAKEKAWSEKMACWEELGQTEKLEADNLQHFREQQLEILIQAKGFSQSVVIITEKRVNVLVPEQEAKTGYQILHDLVTGNLDVAPPDVYIIPLASNV